MKKIIILGGQGDGVIIASALRDLHDAGNEVMPLGFLNDFEEKGSMISGLPVLDRIENAKNFLENDTIFFISALLKTKESFQRSRKIANLDIAPDRYFTLIHPQAAVAKSAKIGHGTFVGPHVAIMPNALIGNHCSFRASANVGHDCVVGSYCYMGPNSTLCGKVKLHDGVHIGPNSCVLDKVEVGPYSVVGLGSVVLKNLPEFAVAFGCPAKIIETLRVTINDKKS